MKNATIEQMFSKFGQICFSEKSFIHSFTWSFIEMISNLYFGWTYLLKLDGIKVWWKRENLFRRIISALKSFLGNSLWQEHLRGFVQSSLENIDCTDKTCARVRNCVTIKTRGNIFCLTEWKRKASSSGFSFKVKL